MIFILEDMLYQNEKMQWCRKCSCSREIVYSSKLSAENSTKYNKRNTCRSCVQEGEKNRLFKNPCIWNKCPKSPETLKKMSESQIGKKHSEETKRKLSKIHIGNKYTLGYKHSEQTREKLRHKIISETTREKLREHRWNQIEKLGVKMANYNPIACQFITKLNEALGLNFQHAENGGEIKVSWYSLDGYDKEKNIVFEYDEQIGHNTPKYKENDLKRQNRIIEKINPTLFLRYDEKTNILYDAETLTEIPISIK